jgi:PleD family two-component response regulator
MNMSGIERIIPNNNNISEYSLAPQGNRSDCNCPKVLIVDDDTFSILALNSMISFLKIKTDYATNGFKALEKLKEKY